MAAGFRKKSPMSSGRGQGLPPGTKVSFHNNQLLISSGVPSLDNILGGGISVGSLLLIEEDNYNTYSHLLLKYFLAEGALCKHGIVVVSDDDSQYEDITKKLPAPVDQDVSLSKESAKDQKSQNDKDTEELKIAWRYQNLTVNEPKANLLQFGHYYDLTKTMHDHHLSDINLTNLSVSHYKKKENVETSAKIHPVCKNIIQNIQDIINKGNYATTSDNKGDRKILRIAIPSIGSPLWPTYDASSTSLTWFLVALRTILRSAFAVGFVTVPSHLFNDPVLIRRLQQCADNAVQLESFAGSEKEKNPAFKDYDGLIHIKKKARINSLIGQEIDTTDWAFKLRRKKFSIEKLHLPPELSETANRAQVDTKKINIQTGMPMCSTNMRTTSTPIDF